MVAARLDGSYCCGPNNAIYCDADHGLFIVNDQMSNTSVRVSSSPSISTCQDLQVEHIDMRVIDCIDDCYAIIDVGSAHSLIP
jgi:hypothetical protein